MQAHLNVRTLSRRAGSAAHQQVLGGTIRVCDGFGGAISEPVEMVYVPLTEWDASDLTVVELPEIDVEFGELKLEAPLGVVINPKERAGSPFGIMRKPASDGIVRTWLPVGEYAVGAPMPFRVEPVVFKVGAGEITEVARIAPEHVRVRVKVVDAAGKAADDCGVRVLLVPSRNPAPIYKVGGGIFEGLVPPGEIRVIAYDSSVRIVHDKRHDVAAPSAELSIALGAN